MKRIAVIGICLLLLVTALPASASDGATQTYELIALEDGTLAFNAANSPAFWEKPTLKAGEYTTTAGTLILRNSTATDQKIGLRLVTLPYGNDEALRYLNHLHITVRSGSTVLYDGTYSRINDGRGLTLNTQLTAGTQVVYTIDMKCDYNYTGEGLSENDTIDWEFYAVEAAASDEEEETSSPFSDPVLIEVLIACGIAAVLLVGVFILDRIRKR